MEFGVVAQTNPPAQHTIALARRSEEYGFEYFWTFDSHILWQEPYVIYAAILEQTNTITVGPMVTNPATRDWSVTASIYATLNATYGNRTICGIGRGDSAVRVQNDKPVKLREFKESIQVIKQLANSGPAEINGSTIQFPWSHGSVLDVWVAAYGPKALAIAGEVGDGFILQCADVDIAEWMITSVREAAAAAGRDPEAIDFCVAAPFYITDGSAQQRAHALDQCRWFGGMVGNHVADIVSRYGTDSDVPQALTDYIAGRQGYDYNQHGRSGNDHVDFVPDEIVERFCMIGTEEEHVAKLEQLKSIGMTQFAGYLGHDREDETLRAYYEKVMPAAREQITAKS